MYRRATISRSPIRRRSSRRWMASAAQAISCNDAGAGPAPNRKSVYNFRSEGREFTSGRCLIIADGFYEFTDPEDNKKKRKDKWLFRKKDEPWFCIAGIWRTNKDVGEAFAMLTAELGPDIAPYHDRQIAILDRADWTDWLDPAVSAKTGKPQLPTGSRRKGTADEKVTEDGAGVRAAAFPTAASPRRFFTSNFRARHFERGRFQEFRPPTWKNPSAA
jgi:putative SOS response-associated peptidase YedK